MPNLVSSEAAALALAGVLFLRTPAVAEDGPEDAPERVVTDGRSGFALSGFDPVTSFGSAPRAGEAGRELIWNGVAWRFASDSNRDAFRRDPHVYAPRLGGHDPSAMAQGRLVAAEPCLFAVVAERLYLFRNEASRRDFLATPATAGQAEARWREFEPGLVRG